jgi:outer membrane protein OmpA-like peptidoglycan-associated protein
MKMPFDQIALTSYNKDITIQSPLEKDTTRLLKKYRSMRDKGKGYFSSVQDAAWSSLDLYQGTDSLVPRVLVLFTDGDDNSSQHELSPLIEKANAMKAHVFAVAFGYSDDQKLRSVARATGGKFYKVYSKKELLAVFKDIYLSLRNYYLISYRPPRYIGFHKVFASINLPNSRDTVFGYGDYNTSGLDSIKDRFERPILFDFDEYVIKPDSYPIIDEIADAMFINPKLKKEIQGHTDNKGTVEHNQILSERRADAVMNALIKKGVEPKRLRSRGFGFSMPKVPNDTEENQAKNRRTEFLILAK